MGDKNVFISFKKKSSQKAGNAARPNRDVLPSSTLGVENSGRKTQLVFKSNSLKGNELRGWKRELKSSSLDASYLLLMVVIRI